MKMLTVVPRVYDPGLGGLLYNPFNWTIERWGRNWFVVGICGRGCSISYKLHLSGGCWLCSVETAVTGIGKASASVE